MSISTARRRAIAAMLAALLAAPLFACGAQPTTTAPGTDAPAADTNVTDSGKKDDAKADNATGSSGVSCEDYRYVDGVLYAIVYNESMNRNFVMAAANDDATVSIMVCNEDVARTGALTEGGGAPTVMDVWHEYFG